MSNVTTVEIIARGKILETILITIPYFPNLSKISFTFTFDRFILYLNKCLAFSLKKNLLLTISILIIASIEILI